MEEKRNCRRQGDEYKGLQKQVRSQLRKDRQDHLTNICQQMNDFERKNKSKDLFSKVSELTKKVCPSVKMISTPDGQTLTETEDILERWREYCETLYTNEDEQEYVLEKGPNEPVPTREEVQKALDSTKSGKAAGPDGIPIELLKLGEDSVVDAMHRIIKAVWNDGKWPEDWTESAFVPLYKKGDPAVCANYGTICECECECEY